MLDGGKLPRPTHVRESVSWKVGEDEIKEEEWDVVSGNALCGFDVDAYDGSYSLDRAPKFKFPQEIFEDSFNTCGLNGDYGRCIEHSVALTDERRSRCFIIFDGSGQVKTIVQCDESILDRPSAKTAPPSSDQTKASPKSNMFASESDDTQLEVMTESVRASLEVLSSKPWVGDTTIHNFRGVRKSSKSSSPFATWSSNVLKIDLVFNDDKLPAFPKQTHLRAGFGSKENNNNKEGSGDIEDGDAPFWTQGSLQEHPMFGLNPRCIEYEGGDRLVILGGGCLAMFPSRPVAVGGGGGEPFHTEFSVLLQTMEKKSDDELKIVADSISDAVVIDDTGAGGDEGARELGVPIAKTHMTRSQRIYMSGALISASSAFLTAGGMRYY